MPGEPLVLKTNLADSPVTRAIHDGRVSSDIVTLDCCGPDPAQNGFKDMVRRNLYDAGELAIVTYLQAKCYGKPWVLLPAPVSGRFQHHCAGYNRELGHFNPKDIEGRKVGVRTYAQTTGLWIRGILQHEYGVDLSKVTFYTVGEGHLEEYTDPDNCIRLPKGSNIGEMMLAGDERKPFSELEQQIFDPRDQGPFDITLVSGRAQGQEVELVGVLQHLLGQVGGLRRQCP